MVSVRMPQFQENFRLTGLPVSGLTVPTGPKAPKLTASEFKVDVDKVKFEIFFITSVSKTGCKSILFFAAFNISLIVLNSEHERKFIGRKV